MLSIIHVNYYTGESIVIVIWIFLLFPYSWLKEGRKAFVFPKLREAFGASVLETTSLPRLNFKEGIWCYEWRTKINTRLLAGKREANWQEPRGRDYPRLGEGTKGLGFPKRWRPVPFSPAAPVQDGYTWEGGSLNTQRRGVPGPGTPGTSKIPVPKNATKHPATGDHGGSDNSPGNWNGREAREVFPECSLCMKPFLWSFWKRADNPRDDWELTSHQSDRMGLERDLLWFTENKIDISCTLKFETKSVPLYT